MDRVYSPNSKVLSHLDEIYPTQFFVRTKCIGLFQKIEKCDILVLVMYVDEFDDTCPPPNNRRVYLSYLDSVKYIQPSNYRTLIFQFILSSYINYIRAMGYYSIHIWACPPSRGDDYIIHCHPKDQKIPREERLRKWYETILDNAKDSNFLLKRSTFYDEFMNKKK